MKRKLTPCTTFALIPPTTRSVSACRFLTLNHTDLRLRCMSAHVCVRKRERETGRDREKQMFSSFSKMKIVFF